jgi:4-carboxymuconolactone decarboxylase
MFCKKDLRVILVSCQNFLKFLLHCTSNYAWNRYHQRSLQADLKANFKADNAMATQQEKNDYINRMVAKRGYAQEYHKVLVQNDYGAATKMNELIEEIYLKERLLDRKTKELILITCLTLLHADRRQIQDHIKVALALGVPSQMILEAIELSIPGGGTETFQHGVMAWQEVVNAPKAQPTVGVIG